MAKRKTKTIGVDEISVVIPTYKRGELAFKLARKIRQEYPQVEIIIVEQEGKKVQVKEAKTLEIKYFNLEKANTAVAKNFGWQKARGKIIIFLDDDVEITKGFLEAHTEAYQDQQVVGVAGRVINDDDKIPNETKVETGKTNFWATKFSFRFWSTKKQLVDFVYGCNMSFRRKVLDQVNGFDEKFSQVFEEIDLSKRVKKYGKLVFAPKALAYHHKVSYGGTRASNLEPKKMMYYYYGVYLRKHLGWLGLLTVILRTATIVLKDKDPHLIKYLKEGYLK